MDDFNTEKIYILKHRDTEIAYFMYERSVTNAYFNMNNFDHFPLPLKGLLIDRVGNFVDEGDNIYRLTEESISSFDEWLNNRAIPVERYNLIKNAGTDKSNVDWMFENHALSFTDNYWVCQEGEGINWDDVKLQPQELSKHVLVDGEMDIYELCKHKSTATLGGELNKYWYTDQNGELFLHKQTVSNNEILSMREVFASLIYKKQGIPHVEYFLSKKDEKVVGCDCKSFTSEKIELVTAYDLLEEYKLTQFEDTYNLIISLAELKGLRAKDVADYLDKQIIVDYLITNRDRHLNNLGFLRDSESLEFLMPAPIYDSGSSMRMENRLNENTAETKINGMYPTEAECLKRVHNFNVIDINKLPSEDEYLKILNCDKSIPEYRKNELCSLYRKKVEHIKNLQMERLKYNKDYYFSTRYHLIKHIFFCRCKESSDYFFELQKDRMQIKYKDRTCSINLSGKGNESSIDMFLQGIDPEHGIWKEELLKIQTEICHFTQICKYFFTAMRGDDIVSA